MGTGEWNVVARGRRSGLVHAHRGSAGGPGHAETQAEGPRTAAWVYPEIRWEFGSGLACAMGWWSPGIQKLPGLARL